MSQRVFAWNDPTAMERRIFFGMWLTVLVAVVASMLFWPWRVVTGLALGGALSLLNHHWLRTSIAAALSDGPGLPKLKPARFVFRYFVIISVIAVASLLDVVSLTATLIGLCSFVVAALIEALVQVSITIINREGN